MILLNLSPTEKYNIVLQVLTMSMKFENIIIIIIIIIIIPRIDKACNLACTN